MLFICYNCDKNFYRQNGRLIEADNRSGCSHCDLWCAKDWGRGEFDNYKLSRKQAKERYDG